MDIMVNTVLKSKVVLKWWMLIWLTICLSLLSFGLCEQGVAFFNIQVFGFIYAEVPCNF
jgi:hypothetical protein